MIRSDVHMQESRQIARAAELTEEIAQASLTGLRQVWTPSTVANGLTPQKLASVLRDAEIGHHIEQLELAEAMEERDAHYGSVLRTRRLALLGLDRTVESYSDKPHDIEMANLVRDTIHRPEFDELLGNLADALGKGYSAVVMDWTRTQHWQPTYRWCDPRWFKWSQASGDELRLIDDADPLTSLPLVPQRWIVHVPRIKSGFPARSGLARLAAVAYMCKSWAMKDWMAFVDGYGLPLRVGKYGPSASKEDKETLIRAVANIVNDGGVVIPQSMQIQLLWATSARPESARHRHGGGSGVFKSLAEYLDRQITKAVLGHTGSADSTPGKRGGASQAGKVRLDILTADAKQLAATLNRDLVRPLIDLNFGKQENYPRLRLPVMKRANTALLVSALHKLVPLGLEVEQSVIRDKLNLPDPERDAQGNPVGKILKVPAALPDTSLEATATLLPRHLGA